jgi:nucleotide-binding universal stress UspA family protein
MNSRPGLEHKSITGGDVLACVDKSAYTLSVCDHANWFSNHMRAPVRLMHAQEPATGTPVEAAETAPERWRSTEALLRSAEMRLREAGAGEVAVEQPQACFPDAARHSGAGLIVMGRRGDDSERQGRTMGSNVRALAYRTEIPVCFAPKIFIPIGSALVLACDASADDPAIGFLQQHAGLAGLALHFVLIRADPPDEPVSFQGQVMDHAASAEQAVGRDARLTGVDLVIASRRALPAEGRDPTLGLGAGFWGWRTPILVC